MSRPKPTVMEYRNYYLSPDFPILLLTGEHWKISDIPSSRLHFHNCLEIGYCHSDGGTLKFYSGPMQFTAGDVTCIPRNIPHTTYSSPGTESRWSYLFFDPAELFRGLLHTSELNMGLSLFATPDFRHILSRDRYPFVNQLVLGAIRELSDQKTNYQAAAKGLLLALFIEISRIEQEAGGFHRDKWHKEKETGKRAGCLPSNALAISPALDYIEDNYQTVFSMEELADICHMSPTHFRRVFHTIMGTSPLDYLNSIRVMKACSLLCSTEEPILAISERVGFTSVSNFNRHFMRVTGQTPRQYRSEMLQPRRQGHGSRQPIVQYSGWMLPEADPV